MNANTNQNINDCDQEKFEVLVRLLSKIYEKDGVTFLAQYDDGMQAPFLVCKWKGSYLELEKLLKKYTKIVYEYYLQELKNEVAD